MAPAHRATCPPSSRGCRVPYAAVSPCGHGMVSVARFRVNHPLGKRPTWLVVVSTGAIPVVCGATAACTVLAS